MKIKDTPRLTPAQMIDALTYVGNYIDVLPITGYENRKGANACIDNLSIIINQLRADEAGKPEVENAVE